MVKGQKLILKLLVSLIEKDNFDTLSKTNSLEYPIYFTYNNLFNYV